jgi:hypothetical protein
MFDHAKGAVFAEDASRQIPNHVAVDALNLTSNDADELAIQLRREGFLQFVRAAGEARAALAQITPRCPDLLPYTKQFEIPPEEVGAVIEILENAQIAATASPIHRWRRKPSR